MAIELVDGPRDDPRSFGMLEQPLRICNRGTGPWANHAWDRGTYLTYFGLVLKVSSALQGYLEFPHAAKVFRIRRETSKIKAGKVTADTAYGANSLTAEKSKP